MTLWRAWVARHSQAARAEPRLSRADTVKALAAVAAARAAEANRERRAARERTDEAYGYPRTAPAAAGGLWHHLALARSQAHPSGFIS